MVALPPKQLRLLPYSLQSGAMQMATDSVLLSGLAAGLSPPSLRFYGWSKPTLSVGYHQKQVWPDLEVVRRPSGGRAVWHEGDLTYALTLPLPQGSVAKVYTQLCTFLIEGFKKLDIFLAFGTAGRGYIHNPSCFGTATGADLVWQGRKLIGSAQVRRGKALLQHGSILIQPNPQKLAALFPELPNPAVVGLAEIQPTLLIETVMTVLGQTCGQMLGLPLESGFLTPWEIDKLDEFKTVGQNRKTLDP
ncbi:MAG: lipoate--protein ligase family protein [Anaerolineae bacterium]|nr:lipoate--protein ligase family protein [Gloeobacterales cyanobacterium ES-bin-313]